MLHKVVGGMSGRAEAGQYDTQKETTQIQNVTVTCLAQEGTA